MVAASALPEVTRIDERLMASLWERGDFDRNPLAALDLALVYRGVPSDAGGPDYQDAMISRSGRAVLSGDIEFHVRSADWYAHGHHRNPSYNRVILHVVWEHDGKPTLRQDGVAVPVLVLRPVGELPASDEPRGCPLWPGLLASPGLSLQSAAERLAAAGLRRFDERAEQFRVEANAAGWDAAAYRAILEAMGYASNRESFRRLAECAPYGWIMTVPATARLQALLSAAGFATPGRHVPPTRMSPDEWRISRIRPGNHPAVRIGAVTGILARFPPHLADGLFDAVASSSRPSALVRALTVADGRSSSLGAGRATEIAASVVLPLVAAMEPSSPAPRDLFARLASPPATRWTRAVRDGLTRAGVDVPVRNAPLHQGMHTVYVNHCRTGKTGVCPLCGPRNGPECATAL